MVKDSKKARLRRPKIVENALPPLLVGLYSPAGKLVRTVEMPDPRIRFCQTYQEMECELALGLTARAVEGGAA